MRKILAFVCALMCFSASLFSETADGIIFAEKLQKILSEGTLEQAINLFSEIPDSLKDDKDLTILKASLIFSAKRYDEAQEIAAEYGISSIPTVILFKDGAPIHTEVGAHDKAFYANLIEMHL